MRLSAEQRDILREFETGLDPRHPEKGPCRPRVLGFGEMSTVLSFQVPGMEDLAFKRMALFESDREVAEYEKLVSAYPGYLGSRGTGCGEFGIETVHDRTGMPVVYMIQRRFDPELFLNNLISRLEPEESVRVFLAVLGKIRGVLAEQNLPLHQSGKPRYLGFDAQLSNWALVTSRAAEDNPLLPGGRIDLSYLDLTTPLVNESGKELLDRNLFLRICPGSLVWLIKWFFLEDVIARYYDFRRVTVDVIANLFKEKKEHLIMPFIMAANAFIRENKLSVALLHYHEIQAYYAEDRLIWRLFLFLRKAERFLRALTGRGYRLILPEKVDR